MINESFEVLRDNILNATTNITLSLTKNCGDLIVSLQDKVDNTSRFIIFMSAFLLIFKMWAINKIVSSKADHDKKEQLIVFTNTMITGVLIVFIFYLIYFIYLSKWDF